MLRTGFFACLPFMIALGQTDAQTLRDLADSSGITVGVAVTFPSGSNAGNRPAYEQVLRTQFNGMVPENAMKFQSLSSSRGAYNWTGADALVEFAEANNMKMRGHTLVWHSQAPSWFNNLTGAAASRDTTLKIMKAHIDTVLKRYRGRIHEWDVVNEAIAQNGAPSPNYRSTSGTSSQVSQWYNRAGGPDYIDSAFAWAHRADTAALLFYNDFGGEFMNDANANSKSKNVYDLVKGLKERGIPIHGVGLQGHFGTGSIDTGALGANMRRIAALGLRVSLTEIDIPIATPVDSAKLEAQKAKYKAVAKVCLSVPKCKTFFVWGLNDNQSWLGAGAQALLFSGTTTLTPKPAFFGVAEQFLAAAPPVALAPAGPVAPSRPGHNARGGAVRFAPDARGRVRDLQGRVLP
jgi:endo-1,4-beta-xylanase